MSTICSLDNKSITLKTFWNHTHFFLKYKSYWLASPAGKAYLFCMQEEMFFAAYRDVDDSLLPKE